MSQISITDQKIDRARFIAERVATVPFVRLIVLTNSVAMGTATQMSDLDFFVVTAPRRLWTARFFLLLRAKRLGFTKRPGKTADQADFGWWIDETALDLSPIALDPDPLLGQLVSTFVPLVDRGVYQRFMAANKSLANGEQQMANSWESKAIHSSLFTLHSLAERVLGSWLGEPIEWLLFVIQRWRIWADPVAHHPSPITKNGRRVDVVTTRSMCKLHHFDQRGKARDLAIRSRS